MGTVINMATNETFADRLTKLRENTGKKRQEVADELEISRASLEYYEKGKRKPDIEVLAKIAEYYGVSCDYLLNGVKSENISINKITGLSDKAIENLKLYNRIKLAEKERWLYFENSGNLSQSSKDEYTIKYRNTHYIDIISYIIENLCNYKILDLLVDIATNCGTICEAEDIEDEIIDCNPELYRKIYTHCGILVGEDYTQYLTQVASQEFAKLINNFKISVNPTMCDCLTHKEQSTESYSLKDLAETAEILTENIIKGNFETKGR